MTQIQPNYLSGDRWMQFAGEEDLFFEALEMFAPPIMGNPEAEQACAGWYRSCGRTRSIHGAFIDVNPASGDPAVRELSRQRCNESCRTADAVGAAYVVLHGSCFPFLRGGFIRAWADSCASFYTKLANDWPKLTLCIENSMDIDTTPMEMLMERIDVPNVCVCLDIGHAQYAGPPLSDWFAKLGHLIGYLHLSDNNGMFDDHLTLGEGVINWREADALYRSLGREMPITLEVGGIENITRSLAFLRENGLFGLK